MAIVSACCGWDRKTHLATYWKPYRHLFPRLRSGRRYNWRRRNLTGAMNQLRQIVLTLFDVAQDAYGVSDSLPVPVVQFPMAPQRSRDWDVYGTTFGQYAEKKRSFFGYRLHLIVTLGGVIRDFALTGAAADERDVAKDRLLALSKRTFLGDKGYVKAALDTQLQEQGVQLIALRRANQHVQRSATLTRLIKCFRQTCDVRCRRWAARWRQRYAALLAAGAIGFDHQMRDVSVINL